MPAAASPPRGGLTKVNPSTAKRSLMTTSSAVFNLPSGPLPTGSLVEYGVSAIVPSEPPDNVITGAVVSTTSTVLITSVAAFPAASLTL